MLIFSTFFFILCLFGWSGAAHFFHFSFFKQNPFFVRVVSLFRFHGPFFSHACGLGNHFFSKHPTPFFSFFFSTHGVPIFFFSVKTLFFFLFFGCWGVAHFSTSFFYAKPLFWGSVLSLSLSLSFSLFLSLSRLEQVPYTLSFPS